MTVSKSLAKISRGCKSIRLCKCWAKVSTEDHSIRVYQC